MHGWHDVTHHRASASVFLAEGFASLGNKWLALQRHLTSLHTKINSIVYIAEIAPDLHNTVIILLSVYRDSIGQYIHVQEITVISIPISPSLYRDSIGQYMYK